MNEDALRALIREAVARRLGGEHPPSGTPMPVPLHASHFRYQLPESDGPCVIEPSVPCTHCGYCQSHGH